MSDILKFSEASSIAMHTMVLLASRPDEVFSAKSIAARIGISENHLSKVLQRLARAGLVVAVRGPKGGYIISKTPDRISLLEVYEVMEGPLRMRTCLFDRSEKACEKCIMSDILGTVNKKVRDYMSKANLSELSGVFKDE